MMMDATSNAMLAPIFADLDARADFARFHAIGGILSGDDWAGLYRRVASVHGCTPDDIKRWHEARDAARFAAPTPNQKDEKA